MFSKQEIERKLNESVNGSWVMSAEQFGNFIRKSRCTAYQKLRRAAVEKVCGGYWIPEIALKMWDGTL